MNLVFGVVFCHHLTKPIRESTAEGVIVGMTVVLLAFAIIWAFVREAPLR